MSNFKSRLVLVHFYLFINGVFAASLMNQTDTLSVHNLIDMEINEAKSIASEYKDSSIQLLTDAYGKAHQNNFKDLELIALYNLSKNFHIKKDFKKTLEYLRKAEPLALELNDKKYLAYIYNIFGSTYNKKDYSLGLEYYFKSLDLKQDTLPDGSVVASPLSISNTLNNIGYTYFSMKDFNKAMKYYNQVLKIRESNGYENRMAAVLMRIAHIYEDKNDVLNAKQYYEKALEYAERFQDKLRISLIYPNLAHVYYRSKNYDKAIDLYKKGIQLAYELGIPNNTIFAYISLGDLYLTKENFDLSYYYIIKAINLMDSIGEFQRYNLHPAYFVLSRYYEKTGNYEKALEVFKEYYNLRDSLYRDELSLNVAQMEVQYQTQKKEKEIAKQDLLIEQQRSDLRLQWIFIGSIVAIVLIILLVTLFLFIQYRQRQNQNRIELEKRSLETEQRLLRSQMNPHFIFNSLSSVQNYISIDDKIAAMSFLSKFAELIRNILENSRESTIPLEDEIRTLNLYCKLEQLRLKNKFDFSIKVEESVDTQNVFVPPMLVQPFVENAIKHGLRGKEGKGLLEIGFKKNKSVIYCTVRDSGIGRKAAKDMPDKKHHSLALKIIQERLEVLEDVYEENLGFKINDLTDEQNNATGTEVLLTIPFEVD